MLKKIVDPNSAEGHEIEQLHGKVQSLAVQIAISSELLLKAILLGSTGRLIKGHNLKRLVESLDERYQEIIKAHFKENGLKDGKWDEVLDVSAQTFVDARYGFEGKEYVLEFRTLQLLNEALDNIYNNYLPNWLALTKEEQKDEDRLKKEVDLIFDEDYQKQQAEERKMWNKALKDYI
jgi:hypothetical protein